MLLCGDMVNDVAAVPFGYLFFDSSSRFYSQICGKHTEFMKN